MFKIIWGKINCVYLKYLHKNKNMKRMQIKTYMNAINNIGNIITMYKCKSFKCNKAVTDIKYGMHDKT